MNASAWSRAVWHESRSRSEPTQALVQLEVRREDLLHQGDLQGEVRGVGIEALDRAVHGSDAGVDGACSRGPGQLLLGFSEGEPQLRESTLEQFDAVLSASGGHGQRLLRSSKRAAG